eukprot:3523857-Ditylum_brightwellii.AAC.1
MNASQSHTDYYSTQDKPPSQQVMTQLSVLDVSPLHDPIIKKHFPLKNIPSITNNTVFISSVESMCVGMPCEYGFQSIFIGWIQTLVSRFLYSTSTNLPLIIEVCWRYKAAYPEGVRFATGQGSIA